MATGQYDIKFKQGETFNPTWTYKIAGVAVNLTGYTARLQMRDATGTLIGAELNTSNGGITLGGSAGTISPLVTSTASASIDPIEGAWDLLLIAPSSTSQNYLLEGNVAVLPRITV